MRELHCEENAGNRYGVILRLLAGYIRGWLTVNIRESERNDQESERRRIRRKGGFGREKSPKDGHPTNSAGARETR